MEEGTSVMSSSYVRSYVNPTSKRHRKITWRNNRYFSDSESQIDVEVSTSNRCHTFDVNSHFIIDEPSTDFRRVILMSNR